MICCCEKCRFVFEGIRLLESCPDCGSGPVRRATVEEAADYVGNRKMYGPIQVYGAAMISEEGAEARTAYDQGEKNGESRGYFLTSTKCLF